MFPPPPAGPPPELVPTSGARSVGGMSSVSSSGTVTDKRFSVVKVDCGDPRVCFGLVGVGSAFCTRRNCSVQAHQRVKAGFAGSGMKIVVIHRNGTVVDSAFVEPSLVWDQIPPDTWIEWSEAFYSLPRWTQEFQAVGLVGDGKASSADVKCELGFLVKAESFKTPSKRQRDDDPDEPSFGDWEVIKHVRSLPTDPNELEKLVTGTGLSKSFVSEVLSNLETSVVDMGEGMKEVAEICKDRFMKVDSNLAMLSVATQNLKGSLGVTVPLDARFEAPTLWGTTGFIADELIKVGIDTAALNESFLSVKESVATILAGLEESEAKTKSESGKIMQVVKAVLDKVKTLGPEVVHLQNTVASLVDKVSKFSSSRSSKKTGCAAHGGQVDDLLSMLAGNSMDLDDGSPGIPGVTTEGPHDHPCCDCLQLIIDQILPDVENLKASVEDTAVTFGGLGLKSFAECAAWVRTSFPGLRYGLIIDPLIMFDRIFGNEHTDSTAYLKMLETRLKLCIETGAEASALHSLQFPQPRLFHVGRPAIHVEPNKPRLNKLMAHKCWKSGGEGVHNHIVKQMNMLHTSMMTDINYAFLGSDPAMVSARTIATMSLTNTVTFITQLLSAIDTIYEKLTVMSKFSKEQAWCLSVQILDRFMEDLFVPKDGVLDAMSINDPFSVCAHLVWAAFKTQDIMATYVDHNFENHPAISTEYVKFLATNSGSDRLDRLSNQFEGLSEKTNRTADDAKKAGSKADAANTKLTELLKEVAALSKKVKTLEERNR